MTSNDGIRLFLKIVKAKEEGDRPTMNWGGFQRVLVEFWEVKMWGY